MLPLNAKFIFGQCYTNPLHGVKRPALAKKKIFLKSVKIYYKIA
jgi:hypothetical protein